MKKINIDLELFSYEELREEAKAKAYQEHEEFIFSCPPDYENEQGEMVQEDLSKWSCDELKEYVEDSIRLNEYLFFRTGELANITKYTGEHEKRGKTELKFLGKIYEV